MKPIKTIIRGIGPHADTEINWNKLQSPIAIVAPYGRGKTFCIEGVLAALYGRFAWYPGSLYDAMTQGGGGEAEISLEFEHGNTRYLATRTLHATGKTKKQTAILSVDDLNSIRLTPGQIIPFMRKDGKVSKGGSPHLSGESWYEIAGPKVGDFDRAIEAMLGDADTALATWFLSQNRYGDLCGQPGEPDLTARRRGVLNNLIGASHLDAETERIAEVMRANKAERDVLQHQLQASFDEDTALRRIEEAKRNPCGIELLKAQEAYWHQKEHGRDFAGSITQAETQIENLRGDLDRSRVNAQKYQTQLDNMQKEIAKMDGVAAAVERLVQDEARAAEASADTERHVQALQTEIQRLESRAEKVNYNAERVSTLEGYQTQRADLQEQQAVFEAWRGWKAKRDKAADRMSASRRLVQELEAVPGVDAETIALAEQVDDLRVQYANALEANKRITELNSQRNGMRSQLTMNMRSAEDSADQARARMAQKPETPGGEICNFCPLLKEYNSLPAVIRLYDLEVERYKTKLDAIPTTEPVAYLTELIQRGQRARDAVEQLRSFAQTRKRITEATAELSLCEIALETIEAEEPPTAEDCSADLTRLQTAIDLLADAPVALAAAQEAKHDLEAKGVELHESNTRFDQAYSEWEQCHAKAKQATADLTALEEHRTRIKECQAETVRARTQSQSNAEHTSAQIARVEEQVAAWKREAAAQQEKSDRIAVLTADLETLEQLRVCFGPKGVRQILIDNAAPELEAIADDLFERATAGRQRLRIATQRVLVDGSVAEAFDILIRDARGERDALRYSGGQLQLILILFRLAVALWVGKLHGVQPDCLFLDEAFDRLGAEGTEDLLRVLDYLGERIGMIVVVTHDPQIAARLRSQVRLTSGVGGVRVETT